MSVATASSTEVKRAAGPMSLWVTGLGGAVFVLASLAVVFYAVPNVWHMAVTPWLESATNSLLNYTFLRVAMAASLVGLVYMGRNLAGSNPPEGISGSIFLGISLIITTFFTVRGFLMIFERMTTQRFDPGNIVSLLIVSVLGFLLFRFVNSRRMERWSVTLERGGWFDFGSYKKTQGLKVRRSTILGIVILLGSGVYTLVHNNTIPAGNIEYPLPFTPSKLIVIPEASVVLPILLAFVTLWFAWRVVNNPSFADFLIATEAEMNKVSWSSRARLIQDTIVVLITVFIITVFLFVVDIFWGWFLSRELINVLPTDAKSKKPDNTKTINKNEY